MRHPRKATATGIAEFKAKLASFIRKVKSGEEIEILDRGVPVAILQGVRKSSPLEVISPARDPRQLAKFRFSVRPKHAFDIVETLLEDRRKR